MLCLLSGLKRTFESRFVVFHSEAPFSCMSGGWGGWHSPRAMLTASCELPKQLPFVKADVNTFKHWQCFNQKRCFISTTFLVNFEIASHRCIHAYSQNTISSQRRKICLREAMLQMFLSTGEAGKRRAPQMRNHMRNKWTIAHADKKFFLKKQKGRDKITRGAPNVVGWSKNTHYVQQQSIDTYSRHFRSWPQTVFISEVTSLIQGLREARNACSARFIQWWK